MDMDVFYPVRGEDDMGLDDVEKGGKANLSGEASASVSPGDEASTPVSDESIALSAKESFLASPQPIVERGSESEY